MSVPPHPPPEPPPDATTRSKKEPRIGAITATVVVVLVSLMIGSAQGIHGIQTVLGLGLTVAPVVALAGVLLGSILTIFQGTRRFAVGFLIASAILLVVTAGACTVMWSSL
jgi:hypothetical protein